MTPDRYCARCGAELDRHGLCPRCLFAAASQTPPPAPKTTPPTPTEIAPHFPAYDVLELVGRGGMGFVFRAVHRNLGRTVALKLLSHDIADQPGFAERFQREARVLASLDHPNIVAVHDHGRAGPWWFLAMEFVEGRSLRELLREKSITSQQALALVAQICEALQFAHDHSVVHRDIKPENILVDTKGRVRILDFGLSKIGGEAAPANLTRTDQVMGTPHYMAPEQWEHPLEVDHRADIYSLGVVFYELLTGELPLGRFAPPSQKVEIDVRLDEVVLRSLEKEPQLRYQQAREVRSDVEHVSRGDAGSDGRTPTAPAETRRTSATLRTEAGVAAAALASALSVDRSRESDSPRVAPTPAVGPNEAAQTPDAADFDAVAALLAFVDASAASTEPAPRHREPWPRFAWLVLAFGLFFAVVACYFAATGFASNLVRFHF